MPALQSHAVLRNRLKLLALGPLGATLTRIEITA